MGVDNGWWRTIEDATEPPDDKDAQSASANSMGVGKLIEPPHNVAIMANTMRAKGTEMIMVVILKGMAKRGSIPLIYMWCAQTMKLKMPAAMVAQRIKR